MEIPQSPALTPFKVDGLIFGQDRGMSITASMVPSPSRHGAAVVLPDDGRFVDILQKRHGNVGENNYKWLWRFLITDIGDVGDVPNESKWFVLVFDSFWVWRSDHWWCWRGRIRPIIPFWSFLWRVSVSCLMCFACHEFTLSHESHDSFAAGHCHATRKLEERPAGQRDVSFVMSTFDYLQLSWQAAGRWVGGYQGVEECINKSHHATWQHHQQKWPKQLETYVCIRSSCRKLVGNYIKTYVFF